MEDTIIRDIKVGDRIRSYDFEHSKRYFMEGTVSKISEGLYHCFGSRVYRDGEERDPIDFRTPVTSWMDWDGRIEVL